MGNINHIVKLNWILIFFPSKNECLIYDAKSQTKQKKKTVFCIEIKQIVYQASKNFINLWGRILGFGEYEVI